MSYSLELDWNNKFHELYQFVEENRTIPSIVENEDLNIWFNTQIKIYMHAPTGCPLQQYRIGMLSKLITQYQKNMHWEMKYKKLCQFIEKNNRLPKYKEDGVYTYISRWCSDQRKKYYDNKLSKYQINKLQQISIWEWDSNVYKWKQKFRLLLEFLQNNNTIQLPSKLEDNHLYRWYTDQKIKYKKDQLDPYQISILESIPNWRWREPTWEENYRILKNYVEEYNKLPITKLRGERTLVNWIYYQKKQYANNKLSKVKIQKLNKIPYWTWKNIYNTWKTYFDILREYVKQNKKLPSCNDTKIIRTYKWCIEQRRRRKSHKLSRDYIKKLNTISGWYW